MRKINTELLSSLLYVVLGEDLGGEGQLREQVNNVAEELLDSLDSWLVENDYDLEMPALTSDIYIKPIYKPFGEDKTLSFGYSVSLKIAAKIISKIVPKDLHDRQTVIMDIYKTAVSLSSKEEIRLSEYIELPVHGMTSNQLFTIPNPNSKASRRTGTYNKWIANFPRDKFPPQEYWEARGVDFSKPISVKLGYVCEGTYDVDNFTKASLDMLFNSMRGIYKLDDRIVTRTEAFKVGECDSAANGLTYVYIENDKGVGW